MNKLFKNIVEITKATVESIKFMNNHKTKATYFNRSTGKMKFSEAMYFIIKGIKKTLQIELDTWFEGQGKESMTKQSFSELRQKISPKAFVELNDIFVEQFYTNEYKKYKGYRLLAIDGSITEIPNTAQNREYFRYYHNQSEWKQARAMVTVVYDIENDCMVESDIRTWKAAERDVAKDLIEKVCKKGTKNDLILFDRGYPSIGMFEFLEEKQVKFLMRVKKGKFQNQIDAANEKDQIIVIGKNELKLRVVNVELSTGETEKLVTNLLYNEFSESDFKDLYFKRWGIEVKYNQLKSKYELENFSGCVPMAIEQDFYANIFLSNMLSLAKNEANYNIKAEKQGLKYDYKVNMNIFIGKMIPVLIICLTEENDKKRGKLYQKVMKEVCKNVVPVRPDRSFPRREPSRKNKYPFTRRRAL